VKIASTLSGLAEQANNIELEKRVEETPGTTCRTNQAGSILTVVLDLGKNKIRHL
jgi:hypothetical protein